MEVTMVKLINFRNYDELLVELNPKINIFVGDNAQGKTNLLESIYVSACGKSFRTSKDKNLIKINKDQAYIGVKINRRYSNKKVEIKLDKNKIKRVKVNNYEVEKISALYNCLNTVIFSPEDLKLIKEGPQVRRNFLDEEISRLKPLYRHNIQKYNKILYQRNNLIKSIKKNRDKIDTLDIWDKQLMDLGTSIIITRLKFINKLSKISHSIHSKITGNKEKLKLSYYCCINNKISQTDIFNSKLKDSIINDYKIAIQNSIEADIEKGSTSIGPHRDDIDVIINNVNVRQFGSQGQQRTSALSLKLAEVELIKNEIGEYPVLLLDDVLSELDKSRRKHLISSFKDIQTIITTTDNIIFEEFEDIERFVFSIKDGEIKKV
ncbi:DNA replication/repair protein RecF [Clostridiaceae bacterium M8S5]|nr:DNA replication/repair protein RecF [Clostridiaceae bacterium M8S5]